MGATLNDAPLMPSLRTGEREPAAPKQARSIEKRRKLLEAGRILFGAKGYEATSIEEITSKAGTAAGAFYQYFSSKRQFLVVLMNELIGRLRRLALRLEPSENMQAALHEFLAEVFRTDLAYFGVVRAWQEAALNDPELGKLQREIELWTQTRILGVFERLQKHPAAVGGQDLPGFARMMDRHFWSLLASGAKMPAEEFDREVKLAADVIYHYLFCGPSREDEGNAADSISENE
jgi:AcrR family transcriptional regulator